MECLLCGAGPASFFIAAQDDLTGRPGRFTFVRCDGCGLVYQSPRLTIERIKPFYDDEYLAHRRRSDWGLLSPLFAAAMDSLDRDKLRIVERYAPLDRQLGRAGRRMRRGHISANASARSERLM